MRIVTLGDTHTFGPRIEVPDGDVLVHCGDHTFRGTENELRDALGWLEGQPHEHKLFIAGNHDFLLDPNAPEFFRSWSLPRTCSPEELVAKFPGLTYLMDSSVTIDGVKFYGSPWQPWCYDWAFNFPAQLLGDYCYPNPVHDREAAKAKWAEIPNDTRVLITHTPPQGILDQADDLSKFGCPELRARLDALTNLRLHVFGHIHEGYGREDYEAEDGAQLTFVNAAICNIEYNKNALHAPIVVDI